MSFLMYDEEAAATRAQGDSRADRGRLGRYLDAPQREVEAVSYTHLITLSVVGVANVALHTRAKAIDVLNSDYVRFARARGLTRREALIRHGLRNLALPAITLPFSQIAEIFGGSVLVEEVFSYPGLGQAAVTARCV